MYANKFFRFMLEFMDFYRFLVRITNWKKIKISLLFLRIENWNWHIKVMLVAILLIIIMIIVCFMLY